jgi:histidinol dehydrogenase
VAHHQISNRQLTGREREAAVAKERTMMRIIRMTDAGADEQLAALHARVGLDAGVVTESQKAMSGGRSPIESVREIVEAVRTRGDEAVSHYTEKLDRARLSADEFRVSRAEIDAAVKAMPLEVIEAMEAAIANIRRYQGAMLAAEPAPLAIGGRQLSMVYRSLRRVGVFTPGGATAYPSTLLMTAVPAQVAGVEEIAVVSPPLEDGQIRRPILAACGVAGISEVYRVQGVAGIAALAYGTPTMPRVDKIVGPGNQFIQLAKKEVQGTVDIDMFAGPSDVLVLADATADPRHIALDLLSQAEHNPGSCILVTTDAELQARVAGEIEAQLATMAQADVVRDALERYSAMILARDMDEAVRVTNFLAPEHLQIITAGARDVLARIRAAGAVFIGPWTPVAVGDYIAGPSHTLPTCGTARFASGLSANDFRKRMSVIEYTRDALAEDAPHITALANMEQLEAHSHSVTERLESPIVRIMVSRDKKHREVTVIEVTGETQGKYTRRTRKKRARTPAREARAPKEKRKRK